MPHKLIYTSAPRLLQAGRSGFGTVAMSRDIPPQAVKTAEDSSIFSRQPGLRLDRVIYAYRTARCADGLWHVLTSVQDAGADYSGRTNHLAQHLILSSSEASNLANSGHTPAGVMLGTVCSWGAHDGFCGWLEDSPHAVSSEPDSSWQFWNAYTGSGYCRLNLCSDAALRGAVLIYGRGLEQQTADEAKQVLCLFAESQVGCPEKGWGTTFTTSLEPNDELSDFRWIGVAEDSPMLTKLEVAGGRVKITFDTPPPAARQPSSAAAPVSPSVPTAASDAHGNLHKDLGPAIDAPVTVPGGTPPRIPPKRPVPAPKEEPFLKRHRSKLEGAAIALVVLAAAAFLLRSLLSEKEFTFKGPLVSQYDGSPKIATLADGGSVLYLNAKRGPDAWSSHPPTDAGRYQIGVERSSWFGFIKQIVPTGEVLEIKQSTLVIVFPADRTLKKQKTESVFDFGSDVGIMIEPPAAAQALELAEGVTVESRKISPPTNDWNAIPRWEEGEYEVRVKTLETTNFRANFATANFTVTNDFIISGSLGTKTNQLAALPSNLTDTAQALPDGPSADVVLPTQGASSVYYLAPGADALQLAQGAEEWREGPEKMKVLEWPNGSKVYRELDDKGNFLEGMSKDFVLTDGLPQRRLPTSQIKSDELIYWASYQSAPKNVYLIGLLTKGDSSGAVDNFLGGGAWLSKVGTNGVVQLSSKSNFFGAARLLPQTSKWILRITKEPEYSEDDPLLLSSEDPKMFSLDKERKTLAMITAQCDVLIKNAEEAKSSPPVGNNYFSQNMANLLGPLQSLASEQSAAQPVAAQLVNAIKRINPPATEPADGSAPDEAAAARLIAGALDCAINNPEIKPKTQLTEDDIKDAKEEWRAAGKEEGGLDWSKIKTPKFLSPNDFEDWLQEPRQKPRSLSEIKTKASEWISYRLQLLKSFDKKQKSQSDAAKKALESLKAGIDKCATQTLKPSQTAPSINIEQENRKLDLANRKTKFLDTIGTGAASDESAQLQIQFEPLVPGQPARTITLLPVVRLGLQQLSQP